MSKRLTIREKLHFKLDHLTESEVQEVFEYVSIMETMKREISQGEVLDDDILSTLIAARENRRARQVFEWESARRKADARAVNFGQARR